MLVKAYGTFWDRRDVDWNPGPGARFRLLGRLGQNKPGLRVADFRHQQGIYVLYGDHGPYYVGITQKQGLGKRLKDHLDDQHADKWTRFSWFGFRSVLSRKDADGLNELKVLAAATVGAPAKTIAEMEALLIYAMGTPGNLRRMRFPSASQWEQVGFWDDRFYVE